MRSNPLLVLSAGASLAALSLAACSTDEIAVDSDKHFLISQAPTDTQQAAFALSLAADADTWDEEQQLAGVQTPAYNLKIDGRWAVIVDAEGSTYPIQLFPGGVGMWTGNWIPAGLHVFEMVDAGGHTALKTDPVDVQPNHANHLVMFGPRAALEHRYFTYSFDVPAGLARFNVINLVRTGELVRVVNCGGPTPDGCVTPLSADLAYGEVGAGDVVAAPGDIAYRVFPRGSDGSPSTSYLSNATAQPLPAATAEQPPIFIAAPSMVTNGYVSISVY
jgi:hypothetical protein